MSALLKQQPSYIYILKVCVCVCVCCESVSDGSAGKLVFIKLWRGGQLLLL